jgi:hypothetical protein
LPILDSRFGPVGVLAIEVKGPKGKISHQEAVLKEINERGGLALVTQSVEDVENMLSSSNEAKVA